MANDTKYTELCYIEGFKLDKNEDGHVEMKWEDKYSYIAMSSTKRFYNCLYLLCGISKCARNLMDYLSETMDDKNFIRTSKADRAEFIRFISEITNKEITYVDQSVKQAYSELAEKNLIIKRQRGLYKVNELYFFKGSEKDRVKSIELLIEIGLKKKVKAGTISNYKKVGSRVIKGEQMRTAKKRIGI